MPTGVLAASRAPGAPAAETAVCPTLRNFIMRHLLFQYAQTCDHVRLYLVSPCRMRMHISGPAEVERFPMTNP